MAHYCTNCGSQLSDSDKFCSNCGQKIEKLPIYGLNNSTTSQVSRSKGQTNNSIKASNFFVPILIMFVGGWILGFVLQLLMPYESIVHVGTIDYLALSGLYIYSCHSSLDKKHSRTAVSRSIFVMLSGVAILILAFFTYASDNIGLAFVLFFVALVAMIVDSILVTITPDWD